MTNPDPSGEGSTCVDERAAREAEYYLMAAWNRIAPFGEPRPSFPTGYWPDIARTAVQMALAGSIHIELDSRVTPLPVHYHSPGPRPPRAKGPRSAGKISAAERAANTAKLLATMKGA